MKFTNEQIKDFLLLTEIFGVLKDGQVIDLGSLKLSEDDEIKLNEEFRKICINFIITCELEKQDRDLIFKIIAASSKAKYDNKFESTLYNSLQEGNFFEFAKKYDVQLRKKREDAIFNKGMELIGNEIEVTAQNFFSGKEKHNDTEDKLDLLSVFGGELEENKQIEKIENRYHDNGMLFKEIPYINGVVEGIVCEYNENGVLVNENNYKNNKSHGSIKKFYDNGKLEYKAIAENGNIVDATQYYKSGKLKATYEYDGNGETHGWYKNYYADGSIKEEFMSEHGSPILETHKKYRKDGSSQPT